MESVSIKSPILEEKLQSFGSEKMKNFTAECELTVTITLAEYRDLVSEVAKKKSDIDKANDDKYRRDQENQKLKDDNAALKAELYELKKEAEQHGKETETV